MIKRVSESYVPVEQAAKELGMSAQLLRDQMWAKLAPDIGFAMMTVNGGWRYYIYREKLNAVIGKGD